MWMKLYKMDRDIKEKKWMEKDKVKENSFILMVDYTMVNGLTIKLMDMVFEFFTIGILYYNDKKIAYQGLWS